jgi:quercetin dioxygenase-like cupin family protein
MKRMTLGLIAITTLLSLPTLAAEAPIMDKEKGIIPNISNHYQVLPSLYDFDGMPEEQISPLISRQYIYGAQSMLVKWTLKKGAVIPLHHHNNEQITWITKGSVIVYSQGKEFKVGAGQVLVLPANVPHQFVALEDTIDIDVFAPVRQDWIDGNEEYLHRSAEKSEPKK